MGKSHLQAMDSGSLVQISLLGGIINPTARPGVTPVQKPWGGGPSGRRGLGTGGRRRPSSPLQALCGGENAMSREMWGQGTPAPGAAMCAGGSQGPPLGRQSEGTGGTQTTSEARAPSRHHAPVSAPALRSAHTPAQSRTPEAHQTQRRGRRGPPGLPPVRRRSGP